MRAVFVYQESHPRDIGGDLLPPFRLFREAKALTDVGWETETLTQMRFHAPPMGKLIQRAGHFLSVTSRLAARLRTLETPDLLVAHDIETLAAASMVAREWSVPLVYDSHEYWPYLIRNNSRIEGILADVLERSLIRNVAHVVTASEPIANRFRSLGKPATVLYNARTAKEMVNMPMREAREELGLPQDALILGYIGNLSLLVRYDRPAETVLKALAELDNVHWLVVGGPPEDAETLNDMRIDQGARNLSLYGARPYEQLVPFYSALDVGLAPLSDIQSHNVSLGNKTFDYMGHGVPILTPETAVEMKSLIESNVCGWTYTPDTFTETIKALREKPYHIKNAGRNGRQAFLKTYCWDVQATKWVKICESLI